MHKTPSLWFKHLKWFIFVYFVNFFFSQSHIKLLLKVNIKTTDELIIGMLD